MTAMLKLSRCYLIISTAAFIFFLSSCSKDQILPGQGFEDSSAVPKISKTYPMRPSGGLVGPPVYDSMYQSFPGFDIPRTCPTPGNIKIGRVTFNSALISWSSVPGADGYTLQYEKAIPNAAITTVQASDSIFVIRGLKPETLYQCRLLAMRSDGFSNYSPWQIFKTEKLQAMPIGIKPENNSR